MLTQKQKDELDSDIQGIVDARVQAQLRKTINKRFTPGDTEDKPTKERKFMNSTGEYSSITKFLHDVRSAGTPGGVESEELRSYTLATQKDMSEGSLSGGGYAVPAQAANLILEKALELSIIRPRATLQPMSTNKLEIPADVDEDHSSSYSGGITISRTGEAAQTSATNPTIGQVKLQLHKLMGLCHVTDELLEDSPALESWLIRKFSQAIAFQEDYDFLNGTGVNQALGMLNAANPSLITVDAETGQGASTIVFENIINMYARLWPQGQMNAIFIANIGCFKQLAKMAVAVGTGGVPVYLPANQVTGRPYKELMGSPIFYTEKTQALGTAGDIALVDPSQYLIGSRETKVASSIHLKFDYDMTSFRFVCRYDGTPSWLSTLTPKLGSESLSPFVILSGSRT